MTHPSPNVFAETPESIGIDSTKLEAVFTRAAREDEQGILPSAQIAIARDGKIAGMRTFGQVTCEGRPTAATNETLYCVFSTTKAFTSTAAWMLIEEGKLDVPRPVADLVPEFQTHNKDAVLIDHLFTHTAGFPNAPFCRPIFPTARNDWPCSPAGNWTGNQDRDSSTTPLLGCASLLN
jgi:CubicO group peptidase (beta-lactamase class C family)